MIKRIPPIILALLWSVPAFAAHPLMTDDTGTQGKGKFQFEYNGEYSRDDEHEAGVAEKETSGTLTAALTYGMTDNLDIVVGLPWRGVLSVWMGTLFPMIMGSVIHRSKLNGDFLNVKRKSSA